MNVKISHPIFFLIISLAVILLVTISPNMASNSNKVGRVNWVPFHHQKTLKCIVSACIQSTAKVRSALVDYFGNLVLFIPFGAFAGLALSQKKQFKWLQVLLIFGGGLLFSTAIETTQIWLPSRSATVDDIILNGSGALLGAVLIQLSNINILDYRVKLLHRSYHQLRYYP